MAHFELDEVFSYQDANDIIDGKGHLADPAEGEVRVREIDGHWVHQKYVSAAWVTIYGLVAGLGDAATKNVGTVAGTVMAGDDSRVCAGWIADVNTWTYSSADAPTFIASVNADVTAILSVGMKIKLTQTTAKYFIITAVGAFGGGVTLVTLYGGTDYTLANAAITSPCYSMVRVPFGFPMDPAKWMVEVTDTTIRSQTNPTQNVWYNLGTTASQISLPIGAWHVEYQVTAVTGGSGAAAIDNQVTLSTANNSESDVTMTAEMYSNALTGQMATLTRRRLITVASKTLYYLNSRTTNSYSGTLIIYFYNSMGAMAMRAICAYL